MNVVPIEIALSKKRIIFLLLGSLLFTVAGCWFLFAPPQMKIPPFAIRIIGLASVLFFGATAVTGSRKLFQQKIGLIIDQEGITDCSSGVSAGFIPWDDIVKIEILTLHNQKFLMLMTKTP